jgi:phage major head subunit gpT-like protein
MEITPSTLQPFFQQLDLRFQAGYREAPTFWQQVATLVPSSTEQNVYGWMDYVPQLRQWVGERYVRNLVSRGLTVTNLTFELTEEVSRDKIADDQYGVYGPKMYMMGRAAALWPDQQVMSAINANANGYDGVTFFSNAHPKDPSGELSGNQSNDLSLALTGANFATALQTGKSYVGRDNSPMGSFAMGKPLLMVGPALEKTARDLVAANFLSTAAAYGAATSGAPSSNTYMGVADMLVNPWITSATAWFLIDRSFGIMPFIWQLREAPIMQQRVAESDAPVFDRNVYQYGIRARGAAAGSLWFLCIRGNT